ncbi:unnamed protein product [Bemisia tabaci]|uniref:Homeobox domain-containing protein n=1 Tax=Bemisia tabaci TaxID=7038 RepID=A0A9P0A9M7_BEMTA|nr:unnamed protein product [Bemisia tabaci]
MATKPCLRDGVEPVEISSYPSFATGLREIGKPAHHGIAKSLKFGVDRILSDEISAWKCSKIPETDSEPEPRKPPCSECVSSLWRCCQLNNVMDQRIGAALYLTATPALPPSPAHVPHNPNIYVPHPIKPFTTFLGEEGHKGGSVAKRKRSWSRAVFSSLQRKGLEKRFQVQKYITKPDRRQLAATLGLTDAQVKVWFQNRRMKWRHSKELRKEVPK